MADTTDEALFLGAAMLHAQRVEYLLYGIVSHLAHLPEAQKDKRFRQLNPEIFMTEDLEAMKATLGQIVRQFGDVLRINTPDLMRFCDDRNLIAHNFVREFHLGSRGRPARRDSLEFLKHFIDEAQRFYRILHGLFLSFVRAVAVKEGRENEIVDLLKNKQEDIDAYLVQFVRHKLASEK